MRCHPAATDGWPVSRDTDFWSSSLINSVAGWDADTPLYLEFGRTYAIAPDGAGEAAQPGPRFEMRPVVPRVL